MAKLILIEDDPGMQEYFRIVLGQTGHELLFADDGTSGIKLVKSQSADLIISDLNMPGEPSGMELIREIRELCPSTPLIVVSGFPTEERIDECKALGVEQFLVKPFDITFFISVIDGLLE